MPVALIATPEPPASSIPPRKRWTRAECSLLESSGIWEQQKLELIDGELLNKMGQNPPHVILLGRIMEWLIQIMGPGRVNVNAPIDAAPEDNTTNEPVPDAIVRKQPPSLQQAANTQPRELDLVVEVSDSSLRFDMTVKARLYARAGIVEYWVLDVSGQRLIVHREPSPAGYGTVIAYNESEKVAPLASPQNELEIGKLFA
jgi:Uma2 family endonuclease